METKTVHNKELHADAAYDNVGQGGADDAEKNLKSEDWGEEKKEPSETEGGEGAGDDEVVGGGVDVRDERVGLGGVGAGNDASDERAGFVGVGDEIAGDEGDDADDEQEGLYEHFRIVADKGQEKERIDKFLFMHLQHSSRNRIQKAAQAGFIHVNDKPVKSNYKVKPGDVVTLMMDRPHYDTTIEPEDIPLDIVYEDDDLMVVNKPAGMVVHPGVGNFNGTLVNAIAWHLKDIDSYDPNSTEVGLVHRIDKDTSGLLVIAKTPEAKTSLGVQFFNKTTHRKYNALVWGHLAEDTGTIVGNIGRDPKDRQRMKVFSPDSGIGKDAVTHYKVLEKYGYTTLVECQLETGRTHQIRAHFKHIGHPLFNDEKYGGDEILRGERTAKYKQFIKNCFDICPRQALHAKTLGFKHPRTGKEMHFDSELPEDMMLLIEKWRRLVRGGIGEPMQ